MQQYLFHHMNINTFIPDLIEAVQTPQTLSSDFLQIYQPLPTQSAHYLVHIDQRRSFCLNERNVYLKNTMENLIAKSLKNISTISVSASIHVTEIKDGIPYGDIAILNNRELAKEIREKQQKGKEVYFQYKDGEISKQKLTTFNFIKGAFGETNNTIFYQGTADILTDYREELYSGMGELQSITYTAENQRSLSASLRQIKERREKTCPGNTYSEFKRELQDVILLAVLEEHSFKPLSGLTEQDKLNHFKQILEQENLIPVTMATAKEAADYGFPHYTLGHTGKIDYIRTFEDKKKNALYFMKESWLPLMDFMKSGDRLPFTKLQLKEIAQNARKIYNNTVENKKPSVAAVAIKITALIEAAEKKNISCFQTDNDSKSKMTVSPLPFLTDAEHSIVEYCCEKTNEVTTAVAERGKYLKNEVPHL